ncbi:hypothetical protein ACB092_08G153000 [Castanea dentata]
MAFGSVFVFFLLTNLLLLHSAEEEKSTHPNCPSFQCAKFGTIGFPFTNGSQPSCGLLPVNCDEPIPLIQLPLGLSGKPYEVINISYTNSTQSIRIMDFSLLKYLRTEKCEYLTNFTLPNSPLISFKLITPNQTLFKCNRILDITSPRDFKYKSCGNYNFYYSSPRFASQCSIIQLPETLTHQSVEAFLNNHGPLVVKRYSFADIKKMTKSFNDKLGEGGYGGVYKGKLQDSCFVAVKVMKESKGNGEEFLNEVASISRTSHVNIVTLKGFCFEGNPSSSNHHLGWETLYKIAIGNARGLEYLHRGCNTRILHFDIKPHNILFNENFCPKISDFGLAKICPREKSTISMVGAREATGYIAPEVFCRSFGGISHKLDVYSYGMMVLEMVGGRKNIDINVDFTSEIYFPHWIYKRLELNEELGLLGLLKEGDEEIARKMIIVSLWCIQTDPSNRPLMSKVVDMLEGSLDSLQIPPKPYLSSPPRSPIDSSTFFSLLLKIFDET